MSVGGLQVQVPKEPEASYPLKLELHAVVRMLFASSVKVSLQPLGFIFNRVDKGGYNCWTLINISNRAMVLLKSSRNKCTYAQRSVLHRPYLSLVSSTKQGTRDYYFLHYSSLCLFIDSSDLTLRMVIRITHEFFFFTTSGWQRLSSFFL